MAEIRAGVQCLDLQLHLPSRAQLFGLDVCGLLMAIGWGLVSLRSHQGNPELWSYLVLLAAMWLLTVLAYGFASRIGESELRVRLWGWAIALRLIGLLGMPLFEDDYFRYLWDGRVFAELGNPYSTAPGDWFGNPEIEDSFQQILSGINYPQLPTIYGPLAELGFLLSYCIVPGALWPWKLMLCIFDLGTLWLLGRMGDLRHALLYALCPLVIQEIAFNGHTEGIQIFLVVLALRFTFNSQWKRAAAAIGAAMTVKITGGLLAPLLLWRGRWTAWLVCAGVGIVPWLPVWREQAGIVGTMARLWEFNSSVFGVLAWIWTGEAARVVCGLLFTVVYGVCMWRKASVEVAAFLVAGWLLLSPVVNAWYLLPLVPLLVLRPNAMGWMAAAAVSLSYATGLNLSEADLGVYDHPVWVRPVEYGLIAAAGIWSWRRKAALA